MKKVLFTFFFITSVSTFAHGQLKSAQDTMVFDLANATTSTVSGTTFYEFPIYTITTGGISSFDYWFQFDETKLKYDTTVVVEPNLDSYSNFNQSNHNLSNTTSGPSLTYVLPGNTTLLKLRFILTSASTVIESADFFACTTLFNGNPSNYYWTIPSSNSSAGISELSLYKECKTTIYPNPASNYIRLNADEPSLVEVYDLAGSKIVEKQMSNEHDQLNIQTLNNAVYWLKISTEKTSCNTRLVKFN